MLRSILIIAGGVALGAALGHYGRCTGGQCPLTSTWWRGALYGGAIGVLIALNNRTS